MADKKISQLTGATTPLAGTEVLPIVQGGSTVKVSIANVTAGRAVAGSSFQAGGRVTVGSSYIADVPGPTGNNTGFLFGGNTLFPCDGAGSLTNGVASLGSGSYRFNNIFLAGNVVPAAGKGIDFSANTHAAGMTSELLNDYEEGTWTPTDASGAGLSLTVSSATYTKIGRQVTAQFDITFPATANAATQLLGGLPFLPSGANFGGFVSYTTHGAALNLLVFASGGDGVVSFRQAAGGSNNNNAAYSGNVIRGVLVYFV